MVSAIGVAIPHRTQDKDFEEGLHFIEGGGAGGDWGELCH